MSENSSVALSYHEETKHSELTVRMSAHYLDWDIKPSPFKLFMNLPSIPLPRDFSRPREESLNAIKGLSPKTITKRIDVGILAEILFFSAGLTRKVSMGTGPYYMRAAPATGALYPIELYVICGDIPGLAAGVYHFNPLNFVLVRLREGDYRAELGDASHEESLTSPVTIALTSLAWRNAWKYGARSYRHWFWDSGVVAANLLATSASEALITKLAMGFVDSEVDRLLGLVKGKEATVALALIGVGLSQQAERIAKATSPLAFEVEPPSREEVEYPIIWKANEASSFRERTEAKGWRQSFKSRTNENRADGPTFPLRQLKEEDSAIPSLEEVILRRGSTRKFARQPISFEQLSTIVQASASIIPLDFLPHGETLIDFYFIANEVSGLPSGSYFFDRRANTFVQLKSGNLRNTSGYLCLEQSLFSDASAVFYLMTDLHHVLSSLGARGYRAAQFEAGIRAGKIYLSSYSLGMGVSGSTFYDDAVTEFFSPHAKDKSTMIAVGIGVPAYRARTGRILPQMTAKPRAP